MTLSVKAQPKLSLSLHAFSIGNLLTPTAEASPSALESGSNLRAWLPNLLLQFPETDVNKLPLHFTLKQSQQMIP